MSKATERKIQKIYNAVYKKVFTKSRLDDLLKGEKESTKNVIINLKKSKQYDEFAKKFAKELAKAGLANQKGTWRKLFEASKSRHIVGIPVSFNKYQADMLKKAIAHNVKMIKSMPDKMYDLIQHKYTSTLIEEVAKGSVPRGTFREELNKHGLKNAKLIARTETAKLQTAITEDRAKAIGSVAYKWVSSNDRRTRESHKEMNNVIVFWKDDNFKPLRDNMRGNAGEFPNCRCDPQPIFDEDDLLANNKVYNYRTDKIIIIKKQELLKALKQGKL